MDLRHWALGGRLPARFAEIGAPLRDSFRCVTLGPIMQDEAMQAMIAPRRNDEIEATIARNVSIPRSAAGSISKSLKRSQHHLTSKPRNRSHNCAECIDSAFSRGFDLEIARTKPASPDIADGEIEATIMRSVSIAQCNTRFDLETERTSSSTGWSALTTPGREFVPNLN